MVILDAERFGLSQLHQLRGRVGRGSRPSLCVAVTGAQVGSTAFHRLKAFASTTDGSRWPRPTSSCAAKVTSWGPRSRGAPPG